MYAVCIDQPKCLLQALIGYHSRIFGSGISLSLIYRSIYDLETAESVPLEQFPFCRFLGCSRNNITPPFEILPPFFTTTKKEVPDPK